MFETYPDRDISLLQGNFERDSYRFPVGILVWNLHNMKRIGPNEYSWKKNQNIFLSLGVIFMFENVSRSG